MIFSRSLLLLFCLQSALSLSAQLGDEHLNLDRPEAWTMRYFTASGLMLANGPPGDLEKGNFALGLEMVDLPRLDEAERTVGFNGTKEEDLNKAPFVVRPLVHWAISDQISLTGTYVPPVEVFDGLETHLAGLFAQYDLLETTAWNIRLRIGGQWTQADGDFTCSEAIAGVEDPARNPFGCIEPSNDTFSSLTGTVETVLAYRLPTTVPAKIHGTVGYTYADMDFDINARYAGGQRDQRTLFASGGIWSFGLGVDLQLRDRLHARLGLTHVPLDVRRPPTFRERSEPLTHFRFSLHWLL